MKSYFSLQFRMLNRQLTEWGIEPLFGYLLGLFAFIGISIQLFEQTLYGEYIYILIALSFILQRNEVKKAEFLQLCFSKFDYYKIRIIENLIISIGFICFLVVQECYLSSLLLLLSTVLFSIIDYKTNFSFTIPTPFHKHPFEFTIGFRNNFYMYLFSYFLTCMSISANNFNLGVFSLLLTLLSCLSYFTNSENEFYVWMFSMTPKEFIRYKLKTIILYSTLLALPVLVSLSLFFPTEIDLVIGFQCLGYLFIFTTMLAKYSIFPQKLNVQSGIVFALTLWFPALLFVILPYLYVQSIQKLKEILQ